ncbi:hypothetical protein SLA2020_100680 [Shorea laevis]
MEIEKSAPIRPVSLSFFLTLSPLSLRFPAFKIKRTQETRTRSRLLQSTFSFVKSLSLLVLLLTLSTHLLATFPLPLAALSVRLLPIYLLFPCGSSFIGKKKRSFLGPSVSGILKRGVFVLLGCLD